MNQKKLLQKIESLEKEISELKNAGSTYYKKKFSLSGCFSFLNIFTGVMISAIAASALLYAAQITFTDGTVISAQDVNNNFTELYDAVSNLETRMTAQETTFSGVTRTDNNILFSGVNLQIVSGSGATDGEINGLGNLIVGYNEERPSGSVKTGSHNIITGANHNYSSYGGLVAGCSNSITGIYSAVSGGHRLVASGDYSSCIGGYNGQATGAYSRYGGGWGGYASGDYSCVNGGYGSAARADYSTVGGGNSNYTGLDATYSVVAGGSNRYTSSENGYADGD